jgi:CAAX prenyl protease-like protein
MLRSRGPATMANRKGVAVNADQSPMTERPPGHGWWAYLLPLIVFMLIIELGSKLPEACGPYLFPLKVLAPLLVLVFYYRRGHYPELRGYSFGASGVALDFAVGIAGGAIWMAPYLWIESMRPEEAGFDPNLWGASWAGLALLVRGIGYGLVTPFMEELFVRSWLIRYVDVVRTGGDFRDVPIAQFRWPSFLVITVWFTVSHMPWEWPVAVVWVVLTTLWLYHRKHLMSLVVVHAGSNLGILAFVMFQSGKWLDAEGNPLSLWFFV